MPGTLFWLIFGGCLIILGLLMKEIVDVGIDTYDPLYATGYPGPEPAQPLVRVLPDFWEFEEDTYTLDLFSDAETSSPNRAPA